MLISAVCLAGEFVKKKRTELSSKALPTPQESTSNFSTLQLPLLPPQCQLTHPAAPPRFPRCPSPRPVRSPSCLENPHFDSRNSYTGSEPMRKGKRKKVGNCHSGGSIWERRGPGTGRLRDPHLGQPIPHRIPHSCRHPKARPKVLRDAQLVPTEAEPAPLRVRVGEKPDLPWEHGFELRLGIGVRASHPADRAPWPALGSPQSVRG